MRSKEKETEENRKPEQAQKKVLRCLPLFVAMLSNMPMIN